MTPEDYEVLKVFNNNVVLTRHNGKEKILIDKGLGFGKKAGDIIHRNSAFEKIFILENIETSYKFSQLITRVDDSLIGTCEEMLSMISCEYNDPLDEDIHIRLIDHIAFTLYRIERNDEIQNPFMVEIETLYEKEMNIARRAVKLLEKNTGVSIPEDEIGFIALHIHSAKNKGKISNTIKYAYICNSAVELIEDELHFKIDKKSIDYARFVTHIRFALERIMKKIPLKNELLSSIKRTYRTSYKIAKKIADLIETEIYMKVSNEEIGYIAMHVERLKNVSEYIDK